MVEPIARRGPSDLPDGPEAVALLARATDGAVVDVEWQGRRCLPPNDLDVVVYRGRVEHADHDRYYAVIAADDTRPDGSPPGDSRVFPVERVDSMTDLLSTFQADRRATYDPD